MQGHGSSPLQHLLLRLSEQTSHRERFWVASGQHSPAPAALPLRWSGPHKAHIMSVSYSRPSQGITAERARPSPGVADEDVEAERVAAVQGHRASARSAELEPGRGPLCTPQALFRCHSDRLVTYPSHTVLVQEAELVPGSCGLPTQAPCMSLAEGVGLPRTPCVETPVTGPHCTSLFQ